MGMNSGRLSARARQPGHDVTFRTSETSFIAAARAILPDFVVEQNPRDLSDCFGGKFGLNPEASILSPRTGRQFFVEVKKQGPSGNAEERAAKHHTVEFYKHMQRCFGYNYHPYVTVFCESLAELDRYTQKFIFLFEPKQYVLWRGYDHDILATYLNERCREWLED